MTGLAFRLQGTDSLLKIYILQPIYSTDFNTVVMLIDYMTHLNKMLISKVFPPKYVG